MQYSKCNLLFYWLLVRRTHIALQSSIKNWFFWHKMETNELRALTDKYSGTIDEDDENHWDLFHWHIRINNKWFNECLHTRKPTKRCVSPCFCCTRVLRWFLFLIHVFDIFVYLLDFCTYACVGDSEGKSFSPSGEDIHAKKRNISLRTRTHRDRMLKIYLKRLHDGRIEKNRMQSEMTVFFFSLIINSIFVGFLFLQDLMNWPPQCWVYNYGDHNCFIDGLAS